jgi:DMSO/TMAO reductase YedYZ molybdopterin-dependent catalytic subunit
VREYRGKNLSSIEDFRENSIKGPQKVDLAKYRLKVFGTGIEKPESLKYEQVTALPSFEKPVTLLCVEGWSVDILWEGVRLTDVFEAAGYDATATPPAAEPKVVIFRCVDGYSTSLPYDYVRDRDILLAYKMNGVELPEERGFPLQVVAEDKWGYKWAKWITSIELSRDTSFRGYWEKRGYGNEAAVPGK